MVSPLSWLVVSPLSWPVENLLQWPVVSPLSWLTASPLSWPVEKLLLWPAMSPLSRPVVNILQWPVISPLSKPMLSPLPWPAVSPLSWPVEKPLLWPAVSPLSRPVVNILRQSLCWVPYHDLWWVPCYDLCWVLLHQLWFSTYKNNIHYLPMHCQFIPASNQDILLVDKLLLNWWSPPPSPSPELVGCLWLLVSILWLSMFFSSEHYNLHCHFTLIYIYYRHVVIVWRRSWMTSKPVKLPLMRHPFAANI